MREMREELAIIKGVGFGLRDTSRPTLWFSVSMNGSGALQAIQGNAVLDFITANGVVDIKDLEGKPCIVETDGSTVVFKRLFKP